ncbi:unnamed protein product [Prunus armeniaca]
MVFPKFWTQSDIDWSLKSDNSGKGSGPSIKASLQKTKIGETVVKLRAPVWCRPKALRCLSQLRRSGVSAGAWHLGRVSSFGKREGVSALVLVVLRLDMLG